MVSFIIISTYESNFQKHENIIHVPFTKQYRDDIWILLSWMLVKPSLTNWLWLCMCLSKERSKKLKMWIYREKKIGNSLHIPLFRWKQALQPMHRAWHFGVITPCFLKMELQIFEPDWRVQAVQQCCLWLSEFASERTVLPTELVVALASFLFMTSIHNSLECNTACKEHFTPFTRLSFKAHASWKHNMRPRSN